MRLSGGVERRACPSCSQLSLEFIVLEPLLRPREAPILARMKRNTARTMAPFRGNEHPIGFSCSTARRVQPYVEREGLFRNPPSGLLVSDRAAVSGSMGTSNHHSLRARIAAKVRLRHNEEETALKHLYDGTAFRTHTLQCGIVSILFR